MALADGDGLNAVTIRAVAARLGARPMSLYTHIASKDELVELMANDLIGEMLADQAPSTDWREALTTIARRSHAAFVEHPWALEAFGRRPRLGSNATSYANQMASALTGSAVQAGDMWAVLGIVNDYVLGHALRVPTTGNARDLADAGQIADLPSLFAHNDARASQESFEIGLETVLDGIQRRFLGD